MTAYLTVAYGDIANSQRRYNDMFKYYSAAEKMVHTSTDAHARDYVLFNLSQYYPVS